MALSIVADYLWWHYRFGLSEYLYAWGRVHRFFFEYFSVGLLARSFFAPFHRISERKKPGFDLEDITETFVINVLMRIVGALVRSVFIILGFLVQISVFAIGLLLACIVLFFPLVVIGLIAAALIVFNNSLKFL